MEAITFARNHNLLDAIREFDESFTVVVTIISLCIFHSIPDISEKNTIDLFKDNIDVSQVAEDDNKLAFPGDLDI